jgi:polar amino acid transport system substrate-binding protein
MVARFSMKDRRMRLHSGTRWRGVQTCALVVMLAAFTAASAHAQATKNPPASPPAGAAPPAGTPATKKEPMVVPGFWDPRRRPERPDLSRISIIRFLTETDYPPFNYAGPDGAHTGFNVDLARLI